MVFPLDHQSYLANRKVSPDLRPERPLISAGYTMDDQLARSVQMGEFAALAEYMPTRLLRKATSTAIAVAQGATCRAALSCRSLFTTRLRIPAWRTLSSRAAIDSRPRPSPIEYARFASRPPGVRHGAGDRHG